MHSADENLHNKNAAAAVYKINNCRTDSLCCTEIIQNRDPKTEVQTSKIKFCVQLENNRIQVWNEDD